ncbi:zinc finger, CCHC-type, Retrotransposon gag domain protein [Artemisia annua]|uniref:Zinc finger, CCHC-type, Retrotransposon gag domain protein n=1 Tax=Artemisia annua TaxID=35608 RepID=A0A2U1P4N6_ARTAN|nr:zinc finger, CCHC-type, Retrotransposon gag domain protein [Artemisia annua]
MEAMVATAIANLFLGRTTNEMIARIRNGSGSSGGGGGGQSTRIHTWLERFGKLKPLSFARLPLLRRQRIGLPIWRNCLKFWVVEKKGDALNWWKAHKQAKGGEPYMAICTWAEFHTTFYKRYFPDSEQQRFEREYNSIYQLENENAGEYMQRFLRLASFVGPIAGDASRQAKHFKWGLKKWVLDRLLNSEFADVSAACDAARNIEIFHEGVGYKRNRDGDRVQPRGQNGDNKG